MKLTKIILIASLILNFKLTFAQSNLPKWNGYIQTRYASDFDEISEFSIRRAKLWIYGDIPKLDFISYKIQMIYRSFKDESIMMQDAYADIRLKGYGKIRVGRFVPDFMLQRMQPDYEIPVLERANVINGFTHNEKQMARQMGINYIFGNDTLPLHFSFGIFNANVDKPMHAKDNYLLYTSRFSYKFLNKKDIWWNIGSSVSYRKLNNSTLTTIYEPDSLISGNDLRFGLETQFHIKNFEFQTEYVEAQINNDKANGWYVLTNYLFNEKYQLTTFAEKYNDLNPSTNNNWWFGAGFNYYFTKNTKIMTDFKAQKSETSYNYLGEIQLQIYSN